MLRAKNKRNEKILEKNKQSPFDLGKLGEKIALHFLEDNKYKV
ncbi:unnamed protein product, partial [marine sediment metagenome]